MSMLTTLPTDAFVNAAFAELLEDVTNLLTAAQTQKPADKQEISFWRRQLNALNKAESYYLAGVRPQLATVSYFVASASRPGALIHRLTYVGGIVQCSCEAGQKQQLCWHHMLINVLERASELESLASKAAEDVSGGGPEQTPPAAALEAWHIGAVIRQAQLDSRLEATAQYLEALRTAQGREAPPAPARPLRVRLVEARRKSAYFTSALYLSKAA